MTDYIHYRHTEGDVYSTINPLVTRRRDGNPNWTRVWCGSPESEEDVEALAKAWWGEAESGESWEGVPEDIRSVYFTCATAALTALTAPAPPAESWCLLDGEGDWWVSEDGERFKALTRFTAASLGGVIRTYGVADGTPKPPPEPGMAARYVDEDGVCWARGEVGRYWFALDCHDFEARLWADLWTPGGTIHGGDA